MSIQSCTIHSNPSAIHRIVCGYLTLIFHVGCVWILSIVFGLYNCGLWHRGCSITYTPPVPKSCAKKNCVDCCWIMPIVIGLYDCIWIVRLYLDQMIVFGLFNCGILHRGYNITYTPPFCQKKFCQKGMHMYRIVAKVILGL